MGYHLRWWSNGQPRPPQEVPDKAAAEATILERFPQAHFSQWQLDVPSPSAFASGANDQMFAWVDAQAHARNHEPVADVLLVR
jgi:hypothetical protein